MAEIRCLKCQASFDDAHESCPTCGERVTHFQKTYSTRLIDGKYQILERLGVGGMGEIFLVRHIHLNEERVIKVMRPNIASDDQSLQRFLQEARTSTMVKHRNLAMLYDFSTLEDGSYYMVWEFIDGTDIQKWVSVNGPLGPAFATEISIQALTGLEHLHSMGLIHRDISPENIMLAADHHGHLLPKVIDFGIAKQLSEGEGGQGLTQTGMFVGKLKYASPEQAGFLKEGEHIDARSDLYSFGVVLYEMLAGRAPFLATNPQGYILKHVTEKPAPILEVNPEVSIPASLEAIVFKALEKDRNDRYKSAGEMVNALEEIAEELGKSDEAGTFGKRLETMPGRSTEARKLPTMDGTAPGRTGAGGTLAGSATVVERTPSGDQATIVERVGAPPGGDQATVVERIGGGAPDATVVDGVAADAGAAATVVESKIAPGGRPQAARGAAPTMVERQVTMPGPPAKSKAPIFIGVAIVAIIAIVAGVVFLKPGPEPDGSTTPTPTATGEGFLLVASPFGETVTVENAADNTQVTLSDNVAPLRASLPPGQYRVTLEGGGKTETHDVTLEAGKEATPIYSRVEVDLDQAVEDVLNP